MKQHIIYKYMYIETGTNTKQQMANQSGLYLSRLVPTTSDRLVLSTESCRHSQFPHKPSEMWRTIFSFYSIDNKTYIYSRENVFMSWNELRHRWKGSFLQSSVIMFLLSNKKAHVVKDYVTVHPDITQLLSWNNVSVSPNQLWKGHNQITSRSLSLTIYDYVNSEIDAHVSDGSMFNALFVTDNSSRQKYTLVTY